MLAIDVTVGLICVLHGFIFFEIVRAIKMRILKQIIIREPELGKSDMEELRERYNGLFFIFEGFPDSKEFALFYDSKFLAFRSRAKRLRDYSLTVFFSCFVFLILKDIIFRS